MGGAIYAGQEVNASSSTFSGNTATGIGGAIYSKTSTVTLTNSTITGNTAGGNGGGGVYAKGSAVANFTTFSGNTAPSGKAQSIKAVSTYTVSNSIFDESALALAGATGSAATFSFFNSSSALTVSSRAGSGVILATTAGVAALNLGALGNNGGTTLTMLPGTGSPVIGAADPDSTTPTVDQRGVTRTSPSTMGAVHVASAPAPTPTPTPTPDPDPVPTPTPTTTPTATPTPPPTPTPSASVTPVVVPVVTRPVVVTPVVLANAGVSLLPVAQRGDAQVVEVNAPASTTVANAPEVSVPAGTAVAPVVGGLPARTPIVASMSVSSQTRAKSRFVPIGTTRSTAAGRVKVPAFKATRAGVYTIRLATPAGKAYYVKVKVTAKKSAK